mmetsp:Transcript_24071/g.69476  ORF Transcript_24071/g.69476 Transcript_24071/m.69476 type:complete len:439 (-) Transcript_24071:138-1454(-)|eukprot:CAMPEP_0168384362 /NCGR_PEP_ID=MMETSP0228-20121227/14372_1 /TAXON_ID=133427 /ORGANISM="Protoceratium reticulatum, Strain CCCM 535 (=CCMP 1889)" /LENGTH=438 /DNA_ID=CAMNT_0008397527 /DNA_START=78 /DNA_END=1394 /DNA_ORIENTATION=-
MSNAEAMGEPGALLKLAESQLAGGGPKAALHSASRALELAAAAGDRLQQAQAWEAIMRGRCAAGKYEESLKAAEAALALCLDLGDEGQKARTLCSLAKAHNENKQYQKAMKAAGLALEQFRQVGNTKQEQAALDVIVQGLIGMEAKSEALRQARQGLAQLQKSGDKEAAALAMLTVVRVYVADKRHKEGVIMAKDTQAAFRELGDQKHEGLALCEMGKLYLEMGQLDQALQAAGEALPIFNAAGETDCGVMAMEVIGAAEDAKASLAREREVQEEAKQLIAAVKDALEKRDVAAFKEALDQTYSSESVSMEDLKQALTPLFERDPEGTTEFWEANHPENFPLPPKKEMTDMMTDAEFLNAKSYDRRYLYFIFRVGMMGYGPGFRLLKQAYRKGDRGPFSHGQSCLRLKDEHDEWEEYAGFHAGILDCALQTGSARVQP